MNRVILVVGAMLVMYASLIYVGNIYAQREMKINNNFEKSNNGKSNISLDFRENMIAYDNAPSLYLSEFSEVGTIFAVLFSPQFSYPCSLSYVQIVSYMEYGDVIIHIFADDSGNPSANELITPFTAELNGNMNYQRIDLTNVINIGLNDFHVGVEYSQTPPPFVTTDNDGNTEERSKYKEPLGEWIALANDLNFRAFVIYYGDNRTWHISVNGNDETGDGSEENPYRTIQHGIDNAIDHDTVLVAHGVYQEHINYLGKNILVESETGASLTIIEKQFDGVPIVLFESGEDTTSILSGFTIRNAAFTGILCENSSPKIINNIIAYNNCINGTNGGGIDCSNSNSVIRNNIIENNTTLSMASGGGIRITYSDNIIIDSNIINNNYAYYNGGGIYVKYSNNVYISTNIIYSNTIRGWGAGISFQSSNNIIINNNTIAVCSTCCNSGGGIFSQNSTSDIYNNIIYRNDEYGIFISEEFSGSIDYNDFFENVSGPISGAIPGNNTIFIDPIFTDVSNNNFSLMANSPCIDAGDPSSPYDPDGTRADMGALYYDQTQPIPTLSEWGLIVLALLLLATGTIAVIRRRRAVAIESR